jgi:formylglycine-generating enzyme required for sulfatase activity
MHNSDGRMHPVADKKPNDFGMYDMSGNLGELCNDWFAANYYAQSPATDPYGPLDGRERVVRGGSFQDEGPWTASAKRNKKNPEISSVAVGFRTVLVNR